MPRSLAQLDTWIVASGDRGRSPDSPQIIAAFEKYGRDSLKKYAAGYERLRKKVEGP
jgi:hypothetical protein